VRKDPHEWQQRWADERFAQEIMDNRPYGFHFYRLRGRIVIQGMDGLFRLVPHTEQISLSSFQPNYILALPSDMIEWSFPPTPKVAM